MECWARFDISQVLPDIPESLTSLCIQDRHPTAERNGRALELLAAAPFLLARLQLVDALPSAGLALGPIPSQLGGSLTELLLPSAKPLALGTTLRALNRLRRLEVRAPDLPAALPPALLHANLRQRGCGDLDLGGEPGSAAELFGLPSCTGLRSLALYSGGLDSAALLSRLPLMLTMLQLDGDVDPCLLARFQQLQDLDVKLRTPKHAAAGSSTAVLPTTLTRLQLRGACTPVFAAFNGKSPALLRLQHLDLSLGDGDPWPAALPPSLTHLAYTGLPGNGDLHLICLAVRHWRCCTLRLEV